MSKTKKNLLLTKVEKIHQSKPKKIIIYYNSSKKIYIFAKEKKMTKATIQSVKQTESAGLFTICFEGESYTEFQKFITKGHENATLQPDLQKILNAIQHMMNAMGFLDRYFRPEGKIRDRVAALPIQTSKLRLYCLRLSDSVLIVGNGGPKTTKTYDEDTKLNGYVIQLQKLDDLLRLAEAKGEIFIEEATLTGVDDKQFDI